MTRGHVAVFGLCRDSEIPVLPPGLEAVQRTYPLGNAGTFYLASTWGEVAETPEAAVLKLGWVRSPTGSVLTARNLLERNLATPTSVDAASLSGNGLVICCARQAPRFAAYQTLMALPQLYYVRVGDAFHCATDIRLLLPHLRQVEVDEEVLPLHFLFRSVPGPRTYFRGIRRLFPGLLLRGDGAELSSSRVRDLRLEQGGERLRSFRRLEPRAVEGYTEALRNVMKAYLGEIDGEVGNLLSGGVDSSVVQLLLNEQLPPGARPSSYSFSVDAESFRFETEYARDASGLLGTRHLFHEVTAAEYPSVLTRAIETLGQPTLYNEGQPCQLVLAERLRDAPRTCFSAQAADSLHGVPELLPIARFERCGRFPGARLVLRAAVPLLRRLGPRFDGWLDTALMDPEPGPLTSPTSYMALAVELELARRCFGDAALARAFDTRRELEAELLGSADPLERAQTIALITAGYEPAVAAVQLFASQGLSLVQFFLDEDVIRATYAFAPAIRFMAGARLKPILKSLLEARSLASLAHKKKGGTAFNADLFAWMSNGPLRERVDAIRTDFVPRRLLEQMIAKPGDFLWNLLTYDIFRERLSKTPRLVQA